MKYVRENSFTQAHGGRYGVPKILVVMTDGQSSSPTATVTEARILHYSNIKVSSSVLKAWKGRALLFGFWLIIYGYITKLRNCVKTSMFQRYVNIYATYELKFKICVILRFIIWLFQNVFVESD